MKKIFINAAFTLVVLLFCVSLKAQQDYVVTFTGDTLYGKIKKPLLDAFKFQEKGKKESTSITPEAYTEYYRAKDSIHYVAVMLPGASKSQFLERVVYGKIQMFVKVTNSPGAMGPGVTMTAGYSTASWYAGFNTNQLLEIKTSGLWGSRSKREKNFDSLISSYPELLEDFKKEKDFSFEMLKSYIRKYNYYYEHIKKEAE